MTQELDLGPVYKFTKVIIMNFSIRALCSACSPRQPQVYFVEIKDPPRVLGEMVLC